MIIPSMILIGLGLMSAWVALTACPIGSPIQYFSAVLALGYWSLGLLSWPREKKEV